MKSDYRNVFIQLGRLLEKSKGKDIEEDVILLKSYLMEATDEPGNEDGQDLYHAISQQLGDNQIKPEQPTISPYATYVDDGIMHLTVEEDRNA